MIIPLIVAEFLSQYPEFQEIQPDQGQLTASITQAWNEMLIEFMPDDQGVFGSSVRIVANTCTAHILSLNLRQQLYDDDGMPVSNASDGGTHRTMQLPPSNSQWGHDFSSTKYGRRYRKMLQSQVIVTFDAPDVGRSVFDDLNGTETGVPYATSN